jgi:hypothetical protein
MSTPEDKLIAAAGDVKGAIVKVESLWKRWEIYVIGVLAFAAGFILRGHL